MNAKSHSGMHDSDTSTNLALVGSSSSAARSSRRSAATMDALPHCSVEQGFTLVHFSAQLKRFLRDRWYIYGFSRGCVG
jgi:hypothetical protein